MDQEQFLQNLNWRYAVKKFDPSKKLSDAQLDVIEESLRLAPSSFGIQPWKFYRVDDKQTREAVKKSAYNQPQITDASHLFILASKTNLSTADVEEFIKEIAKVRGVEESMLADYKNSMVGSVSSRSVEAVNDWAARQVYIALGFGLMAAAQNMIDACPMEGFDPKAVGEIIGAQKDGYEARVILTVGFRAANDMYASLKKVRFSKEKVFKII